MKHADLGLNLTTKRTRKREFLDEMNRVVPWAALVELVAWYAPEGKRGRPPFSIEMLVRVHFMQQWFTLSNPAMEEALHDTLVWRKFAGLDNWTSRLPDETTVLRFPHLMERHKLAPHKRADAKAGVTWNVAMRSGKRAALDKSKRVDQLIDQVERLKASIRAKVEHFFRVIKRQFGPVKVRCRGLKKNTAQLTTLFALFNRWMARRRLLGVQG